MAEIRVDTEQELMEELLQSAAYKEFKAKALQPKIDREKRAWELLLQHKGHFTRDSLNQIFDVVDHYEGKKRWFGSLLATPNTNLIFATEPRLINEWLDQLLFSNLEAKIALNICLKKLKIRGASKGLATLLLYLSAPDKYAVWVNSTEEGLSVLGRIDELKANEWGQNYVKFNKAAADFRRQYALRPQEIDWALTFIATYVEGENSHFRVDEDTLTSEKLSVNIGDEADLEDIVGEPMELGLMRWAPTNEMGVVALFVEFRRELSIPFPLIEVIRTGFPDAAVFEESVKGYVRKYVEFEFRSSGYKSHLKSKRKCHYVVCWEHNWKDCPIPVIELKQEIPAIIARNKIR
jgi:hypothetical protein